MTKAPTQNDIPSNLNERLSKYLECVDQEREEIRLHQLATSYARRNQALYAAQKAAPNTLALRLKAVTAGKTSPLRSRFAFPMALQSYLRA